MKCLRLLMWEECNRDCPGCCNKDWDLNALPQIRFWKEFKEFDQIMLTGGEPMLYPERIVEMIHWIKLETDAPVYVYTAKIDDLHETLRVLNCADGMTVTLHEQADVEAFQKLQDYCRKIRVYGMDLDPRNGKSLRLNVFAHVKLDGVDLDGWNVKSGIKWIKDCPLPTNETFMRW